MERRQEYAFVMFEHFRICLFGLLLAVLAGGCSTTITNLTPNAAHRSPDGLYTIEARWDTNQRTMIWDSLEPYIIIDGKLIPMQKSDVLPNQWRATIEVPQQKSFVIYQFKFNYLTQGFGSKHPDSRLSRTYQLRIVE
ncbi:MAG: hypothetical protein QHJ82_12005 [Verrucomicrobiota bacterium]|nr:hypothetical protein [Verrucomicrobiota bacterium]